MATKTKGGILLPLVLVAGVVAYFGGEKIMDATERLLGSDPVIVGSGDAAIMVAGGAESMVEQCTAAVALTTKRCGDLKVVIMDAVKMPYITRNISLAWAEGKDFILTKNSKPRDQNYKLACGAFVKKYADGECDEYPFAMSIQGGAGARTEEVPRREQRCQGAAIGNATRWQGIKAGEDFLVIISNPSRVEIKPYQGQDVAEDTTSCGS
ncbi:NucA/NucB deoxyribonuclease domain-containing protein [Actinokineospora sp. 24-640]